MLARLTMLPWLILIVALAPQANSLSTVLKDAADRFDVVRMHGQPADESAEFVNFLVRQEPNLGDDPVFRHAEARYLLLLGDLQHSREVFARIPDDALSDPSDLLARLADAYGQDPARALSLAGRASSTADPEGRNLFVDWVHGVLASRLAPSRGDHVQERAFLEALFTSGDDIQNKTTAALRMWAEAQTTRDPARLRQLMSEEFPDPLSYGPRYQLLLYDLVERQSKDPSLLADAANRRHALVERLLPLLQRQPAGRGTENKRICYWIAFARNRETQLLRKAHGGGHELFNLVKDAAICSANTQPPMEGIWTAEMIAMGGRREYLTDEAEFLEAEDRADLGIELRVEAATVDPAAIESLALHYANLHPQEPFDAFWSERRFRYAPDLPEQGDQQSGGSGRWRIVKVWRFSCRTCVDEVEEMRAMARRFPKALALFDPVDPPAAVDAYMAIRAGNFPIVHLSEASTLDVGGSAPMTLVVNPANKYIVLDETRWVVDSAYWLVHGR